MAGEIIRQGDPTNHGGKVLEGSMTDICHGKPIAYIGHKVSCPQCKGTYPIVEGVLTTTFYGKGVAVAGMKTACGATLIATNVISPFIVPLKITLMAAFLIALPIVLYQVWAFVAPGLYSHEKRLVLPLVVSSTLLFIMGVAFCYFFVFGQVFAFIQGFAPKSITAAPDSGGVQNSNRARQRSIRGL